jgi:hypothetical protein
MSASISMRPWIPSPASHQVCERIFVDSPLKADRTKFTYKTTNDYGKKLQKLLFCTPRNGFSSCFFENIREIGEIEGFKVLPSESIYPVRDAKLKAADGTVLEPTCSASLPVALERTYQRVKFLKNHAAVCTDHPSFFDATIGIVAENMLHRRTSDGLEGVNQRDSRLYFEGGDCFHLTNRDSVPKFLIGEDLLIITHQTLQKDQWFHEQNSESPSDSYFYEELLFSDSCDSINHLFMSLKIPVEINEMAQQISVGLDDEDVKKVLGEMDSMGLFSNFVSIKRDKSGSREIVANYLAQKKFVEARIFPNELKCEPDQIKFLQQFANHLDTSMAPGPKGSIFLQNYDRSVQLLQTIQINAKSLNLNTVDVEQLESFIEMTEKLGRDLKPLMQNAKQDLEDAGFVVISTPGAFYSLLTDGRPFNVNFLNCLTGFSDKSGHFYYVASGTQTEGRLGKVLMDAYVEFLNHQCNNIVVYFVGRKPDDEKDFSEATIDMNDIKLQLGPHGLSFELEIEPHRTLVT